MDKQVDESIAGKFVVWLDELNRMNLGKVHSFLASENRVFVGEPGDLTELPLANVLVLRGNTYAYAIQEARDINKSKPEILPEPLPKPSPPDIGLRYNEGKPKWSLIDFKSMEPMVRVAEYGAKKYALDNWH